MNAQAKKESFEVLADRCALKTSESLALIDVLKQYNKQVRAEIDIGIFPEEMCVALKHMCSKRDEQIAAEQTIAYLWTNIEDCWRAKL